MIYFGDVTYRGSAWAWQDSSAAALMSLDSSGNLTITGNVDGRNVSADGALLDSHLNDANDEHSQYALLAGRAGGQILYGGSAASNVLDLRSTAHATKGLVRVGSHFSVDESTGYVGINPSGTSANYQAIYLEQGNVWLQSTDEQTFTMKRVTDAMTGGRLGDSVLGPRNPVWHFGRIIASPPLYKAEWRLVYSDDDTTERAVFSMESTGTFAGVRLDDGSFFEGFISGESEPMYRINSYPTTTFEAGPGGSTTADVALRRTGAGAWQMLNPTSSALASLDLASITVSGTVDGRDVSVDGATLDTLSAATSNYTLKATLTTTGDMYYASSASTPARLAVGSANQVLGVSGGLPTWSAQTYLDHGSISGLSDDDHSIYLLASGSRSLSGAWAANARIYNSGAVFNIGASATTGHSLGTNDVIVGGALEVDGIVYPDAGITMPDAVNLTFAGTTGMVVQHNATFAQNVIGVGTAGGNHLVLGNSAATHDYDHASQTNPTLFIHSATDPDSVNTQWIGMYHDQTDSRIDSGLGGVIINGATSTLSSSTATLITAGGTINQSSTAGYTALAVKVVETATGSGTKRLLDLLAGASGTTSVFSVSNAGAVTVASTLTTGTNNITTGSSPSFANSILALGNQTLALGDTSAGFYLKGTISGTPYCAIAAGANVRRNLILLDAANYTNNYAHASSTNPTFFVHSATAAATATDQWGSLAHDQTDFVITTGKGNIKLSPLSGKGIAFPGSLRWLGYTSSASTPSTTELPSDKDVAIHKDTGTSKIYLAYNDGGSTIKKVELT